MSLCESIVSVTMVHLEGDPEAVKETPFFVSTDDSVNLLSDGSRSLTLTACLRATIAKDGNKPHLVIDMSTLIG